MSSPTSLPIEIWEPVLEYAIFGTLLFSVSPLDYPWRLTDVIRDWVWLMHIVVGGRDGEWKSKAMREFRQTRTRLRSVCRFWRGYVDSLRADQYYMQVYTVRNRNPSINDVISARRLEVINPKAGPTLELEGLLAQILLEEKQFTANLLIDIEGAATEMILKDRCHLFPHLTALHLDLRCSSNNIATILDLKSTLPRLRSLTCLSLYIPETFYFTPGMFQLPNLTTLSVCFNHSLSKLHIKSWCLPSLRHLRLIGIRSTYAEQHDYQRLFSLSSQLRTLCIHPSRVTSFSFQVQLHSLWTNCPHLTRLQAPLSSIWTGKVFIGRSLAHLVNIDTDPIATHISNAAKSMNFSQVDSLIPRTISPARELRIITDSHLWMELTQDSLIPVIAKQFEALGIRYEDADGLTMEEYQKNSRSAKLENEREHAEMRENYLDIIFKLVWSPFQKFFS
ncbi:hypothetical protein CPB86DRAFT_783683 [Serendipita vermifera]|nr:hypothetical protein CPB86DRAFT_783683 [Serendipita vermifera]